MISIHWISCFLCTVFSQVHTALSLFLSDTFITPLLSSLRKNKTNQPWNCFEDLTHWWFIYKQIIFISSIFVPFLFSGSFVSLCSNTHHNNKPKAKYILRICKLVQLMKKLNTSAHCRMIFCTLDCPGNSALWWRPCETHLHSSLLVICRESWSSRMADMPQKIYNLCQRSSCSERGSWHFNGVLKKKKKKGDTGKSVFLDFLH